MSDNKMVDINENNESDNIKKKEKRRRNRPSKKDRYKEERMVIVETLEKLMGLNDENRGVLLYDLEKNEELKSYLLYNLSEIKEKYKCGNWNYFIRREQR